MIKSDKKSKDLFLAGGLISSSRIMGTAKIYRMIFKIAWSYKRTIIYSLRNFTIKNVLNFLYVKLFIPTGEGAGGALCLVFAPLIRKFSHLVPYPKSIGLEITTVCDLKCNMCEHSYWNDQDERHLGFNEFLHIIDQFPGLKCVNPTGEGSSFLNPDYIKMLRYLKSKSVFVYFIDNFIRMKEDLIRELVEIGIDGIYASIDAADRDTYDKIRRGGDFNKVVANLKRFIEIKKEMNSPLPELCSRYTIQKLNVNEMPHFVKLIASLGNRSDFGDGARIDFCGMLNFKETEHIVQERLPQAIISDTLRMGEEKDINILFQHIGTRDETKPNPSINSCLCWMAPFIMMGGYVLPCCSVIMSNQRAVLRKHAFGNLFESSFRDIWNSERYRKFRSSCNNPAARVPRFCSACRIFETKERIQRNGIDPEL